MRRRSDDDVFIGVDYGTSGVRFVAIDPQGVARAAVGVQAFPSWRDEAVTSLGSTLVLKVLADRPVFAPDFGIYSHRLGDVWLAGGASNSGGAVLAYFFSVSRITELSGRIEPERSLRLDY